MNNYSIRIHPVYSPDRPLCHYTFSRARVYTFSMKKHKMMIKLEGKRRCKTQEEKEHIVVQSQERLSDIYKCTRNGGSKRGKNVRIE